MLTYLISNITVNELPIYTGLLRLLTLTYYFTMHSNNNNTINVIMIVTIIDRIVVIT